MVLLKSISTQVLSQQPHLLDSVHILDVRTSAEWAYVGVPIAPRVHFVEWIVFPDYTINQKFFEQLASLSLPFDEAIFIICRSGVRSREAGQVMAGMGYVNLTNISDGFEGNLNTECQRGQIDGWKNSGLPWRQS